jgi:hypothetical protein
MNILNKQANDVVINFGVPKLKREKYQWAEACQPGVFKMVKKENLNIDGAYQRDEVSRGKVVEIARNWDWKLFGSLSVIERPDGTLWIYDGGHRCRASFYRDDIADLPCMIFKAEEADSEARAFIGSNTMKSNVAAYHIHRASVVANEPTAMKAVAILQKHGFKVTQGESVNGFCAIGTMHKLVKKNPTLTDRTFELCAKMAKTEGYISGTVLTAIYECALKLEGIIDIFEAECADRLCEAGLTGLNAAIVREKVIVGKGGPLVAAKAVLDILNKGRRRKLSFDHSGK